MLKPIATSVIASGPCSYRWGRSCEFESQLLDTRANPFSETQVAPPVF